MLPPAPGRFSITNGCPRSCSSFLARVRASTSLGPPGVNATIRVTGRVGYSARADKSVQNAARPTRRAASAHHPSITDRARRRYALGNGRELLVGVLHLVSLMSRGKLLL